MMSECKLKSSDGHCTKWGKNRVCKPSDLSWCDEDVKMIDADRMCRYGSIFGNSYCYITEQQLEELKNGKVLYHDDGEYGIFIALKEAMDNEH